MIAARRLIGLAVMTMCTVAVGPSRAEGPGWVYNRTVVTVVNTVYGGFNVRVTPELTGCTPPGGYGANFGAVHSDHAALNRMKADVLISLLTGKQVAFYFTDSTCKITDLVLGPY